jgi:oligopeptide transport system ATP-binding protein
MENILEVKDLTTSFSTANGKIKAVNGISFAIKPEEIVGIVGESGCGKSVSMRSVMRILPEPPAKIERGSVLYKGKELLTLSEKEMLKIRGKEIAMVFQDAMTSLNPLLKVGTQISEMIQLHMKLSRKESWDMAEDLLNQVGIPNYKQRINEYPHQFSGGMRQRAMIAMSLSCNPSILIADEPTTALDVTVQLQITKLVQKLQEKTGMAVIWITHDLGVIARLVQKVMVFYAGYIIEKAPVDDLYAHPLHPYTQGLLSSLPRLDVDGVSTLTSIPGQPPNQLHLPVGCPFQSRCLLRTERCIEENPILEETREGHYVACWEKERATKQWEGRA